MADTVRLMYHRGDVITMLMNRTEPTTTIESLAEMAGCSRGTVSGLLDGTKRTNDTHVEAMARAFGWTLAQLDEEVRRLNEGAVPEAQRPRAARTRIEDYNEVLEESVRLGRKIASLPTAARSAITAIVSAFADAYSDKS